MNRNTQSRFALNPTSLDMSRSSFNRDHSVKTSFNAADLIPFYVDEVLPGDTFSVKTSKVIRMQTLLTPVMDNLYCDFYFFFVPNRLTWEHWKQFMGENTESAWLPSTEYSVPQLTAPDGGWSVGTIADYMGVPTGVSGLSVNALPFRAYALICNEWFRDENLTDPLDIPVSDATVAGVNTGNYITDVAKGGLPFKAAKYHDYFTSCLPSPQKGPDVLIPGGTGANVPVRALPQVQPLGEDYVSIYGYGNTFDDGSGYTQMQDSASYGFEPGTPTSQPGTPTFGTYGFTPLNLWAVGDGSVAAATINQLRLAFQIQKLYEKDARGGTRYIEILKSHFGVTSPDSRLQRPEYLGGSRIPVNINQVIQQSGTFQDSSIQVTPQGTTTGQSLTTDVHGDFSKSFVEHGFVIGVMCVRYDHTYQQGLERFWSRQDRFDYYWPVFANIGEQAVKNKEIYAQGTAVDDEVFGYQEAWADYRYKPSHVTGEMRSQYAQSLDVWHLADDYDALPALSDEWIREDANTVNRCLAVTSEVSNQFFADIFVQCKATRPMPIYSIPGLIDHH